MSFTCPTLKSTDFQPAKSVVQNYSKALDEAQTVSEISAVMDAYLSDDYRWKGMHPFNEIDDKHRIASEFWAPLKKSLTPLQRRPDIFFAGLNEIDDFQETWVVETGHFMGLFDSPWLNIPPTGKITFMRYAQFHRVKDGKNRETTLYFDIPMVMKQAGVDPFPPQTGAFFIQPGPMTHDGLLYDDANAEVSQITLNAIHNMLYNVMAGREDKTLDGLGDAWHDDMIWYGPCGIGATYTKARYQKQHRQPLVKQMDFNVSGGAYIGHIARLAEGNYGGFFGWPNFCAIPTGGFMGMPANPTETEWRVVDIYRVQDGKIAENWVFMDLLHLYEMQGVSILNRMLETTRS